MRRCSVLLSAVSLPAFVFGLIGFTVPGHSATYEPFKAIDTATYQPFKPVQAVALRAGPPARAMRLPQGWEIISAARPLTAHRIGKPERYLSDAAADNFVARFMAQPGDAVKVARAPDRSRIVPSTFFVAGPDWRAQPRAPGSVAGAPHDDGVGAQTRATRDDPLGRGARAASAPGQGWPGLFFAPTPPTDRAMSGPMPRNAANVAPPRRADRLQGDLGAVGKTWGASVPDGRAVIMPASFVRPVAVGKAGLRAEGSARPRSGQSVSGPYISGPYVSENGARQKALAVALPVTEGGIPALGLVFASGQQLSSDPSPLKDARVTDILQQFHDPRGAHGFVGLSVALSRDDLLIGVPRAVEAGAADPGAAYLFDLTTGNLKRVFNNPRPVGILFGLAVGFLNDLPLIGGLLGDGAGGVSGVGFLFDPLSGEVAQSFVSAPGQPGATGGGSGGGGSLTGGGGSGGGGGGGVPGGGGGSPWVADGPPDGPPGDPGNTTRVAAVPLPPALALLAFALAAIGVTRTRRRTA